MMFALKVVNEKKSSIADCNLDQSKIPEWFSTLLLLLLMSGHSVANVIGRNEPGEIISCSVLKNSESRKQCENFISSHEGNYTVRYFEKGQTITGHDSFTIYILPPSNNPLNDVIEIKDTQNVAFIGDSDADGNYPTLRDPENIRLFQITNCQKCMLTNFNIDPVNESRPFLPFSISGEKTEIELRNIKATHYSLGLISVSSAKSIVLDNIRSTYGFKKSDPVPESFFFSAIAVNNCDEIKAKSVWLHHKLNLGDKDAYQHAIYIIDPVNVKLEDIHIGLNKDSYFSQGVSYIEMAFHSKDKYSQPDGSVVNVAMSGLHFGVYPERDTSEYISVPEDWPENRHILGLSKSAYSEIDTAKVTVRIVIENNDDLLAITSQPGVQPVTGKDLFYNLNVTFTEQVRPILNLFTSRSTFISNSTSSPRPLQQDCYNSLECTVGTVVLLVGMAALIVLGFHPCYHRHR